MSHLSLRGVSKRFGAHSVLHGIDLDIERGEFLVLVGPSGCGKSTLLRMIAGLEDISDGDLLINGVRANAVRAAQRGVAMVFQSYALYPHMTVAENMAFSLRVAGMGRRERRATVERVAETLQISSLLDRLPRELSGGQRQRVAIGRAIVRKPEVFLFDEPLSNLDASLRVSMRVELARLHQELGTTMVYVTHDQVEAMTLGSRIALLHEGRLVQLGAPLELYRRPATTFVARFLGAPRINLVPRPTAGSTAEHLALWSQGAAPPNAAEMGLRPEHLHALAPAQGAAATLEMAEHLGDTTLLHLRMAGLPEPLVAKVSAADPSLQRGAALGVRFEPGHALYFDAQGQRLG